MNNQDILMLSEERQKELYNKIGNDLNAWTQSAEKLLVAANKLKEYFDTYDFKNLVNEESLPNQVLIWNPMLLLYGYTLECLFKALLLKKGYKIVIEDKISNENGFANHKLHEMADFLKFTLNQSERDFLIRLSKLIISIGRYPIPAKWDENKIQKFHSGGKGQPIYPSSSDAADSIKLIERLNTEIKDT